MKELSDNKLYSINLSCLSLPLLYRFTRILVWSSGRIPTYRLHHSTIYYFIACTLESFLESEHIDNITNTFYQEELDHFIQDSRFADLNNCPLLKRNTEYLFRTFYDYETEVTFKTDNPSQDYSDKDLDDTLPYHPLPPTCDEDTTQIKSSQFQESNEVPQLDGASDSGEAFVSAIGSPAIWKSYALNRRENQYLNWDHLGECLMQLDPTIVCTVKNNLMVTKDEQIDTDHNASIYSEIEEVVDSNNKQTDNMNQPFKSQNANFNIHEISCSGMRENFFI